MIDYEDLILQRQEEMELWEDRCDETEDDEMSVGEKMSFIGRVYSDPDGVFKIVGYSVAGDTFDVQQIQTGALNYGREYIVPAYEVLYFLGLTEGIAE